MQDINRILNISVVQTNLYWEDVNANLQHLESKIAAIRNCDLIVLPEMFSTGFSMRPELFARESGTKSLEWLLRMSRETGAAVCGSMMRCEGDLYYNALAFVTPEGRVDWYNKRHLFSPGEESLHYSKGHKRLIINWKGWKICPLICYDLRFPVFSRNTCNYDLLIYVANWPAARNYAWQQLLKARAIENQCYVVACNRTGEDGNGVAHSGNSCIVNYMGEEIGFGDKNSVYNFNLSGAGLEDYRRRFPVLEDRDDFTLSGL